MNEVINNLKEKGNQIINFENHLVQKVNSITAQMSAFIHAGELDIESLSRSVIHLQSEAIVTAWTQACKDAILELQHLTAAVLGGWAPQGLLHPLERGKLLSANLNNETFQMTFFIERFYAVMADCRQLKNAPPVCKLPGPSFFRPGRFRDAWTIGIDTIVYSVENHATSRKTLGVAPSCRVKKINDFELPYFCWGERGFSGKADSPIVASTNWYAMTVDGFDQQAAVLVRKFGLHNKVWKKMGTSGISHFAQRDTGESSFPPWAMVLSSSVATFICMMLCVGLVGTRMWRKTVEMQNVISVLRTEVNDLRAVVLTARARAAEQDEAVQAELSRLQTLFGRVPG